MEAIKFVWEGTDTFTTIYEKLLKIKGCKVVNKQNEKITLTIFDVSEIQEIELSALGDGFFRFLNGDINYATRDGHYNFKATETIPMWEFSVEYGFEDKKGTRISSIYHFTIPRKGNYEDDAKQIKIMFDENHPFVFYELKHLKSGAKKRS